MNHDLAWGALVALGVGFAYIRRRMQDESEARKLAELRAKRAEFFSVQQRRWRGFYLTQKEKYALKDEEILTRFIFVTWGEISGVRYQGFSFINSGPRRDEVLEVIGNDELVPQSVIDAWTTQYDRDGQVFGYLL